MPYSVEQLIEDHGPPVCVKKDDCVDKALNQMMEHDFSQLPVIDDSNYPLGMVTNEGIIRGVRNFGVGLENLHVRDVMVAAPIYNLEDDLFDLLDTLKITNAVLIINPIPELEGIVTSYDSTEYFRRRAEDLMQIEDIEATIKDFIEQAYTDKSGEVDEDRLAEAISKCAHPASAEKEFEELSLSDYNNLLLRKETWDFFVSIFGVSRKALQKLLDDVRMTRNALVHFQGEINIEQQDKLQYCANWLAKRQEEYQTQLQQEFTKRLLDQSTQQATGAAEEDSVELGEQDIILDPAGPRDSRYAPLIDHLLSQPGRISQIQLTFEVIEKIIEGDLPNSARQHRAWWANDSIGHSHSKQWLGAGWRTSYINLSEGRITFARVKEREKAYINFFSSLLRELRTQSDFPVKDVSPGGTSWIVVRSVSVGSPQRVILAYSFSRDKRFRVELYIDTGDQESNKQIFDRLYAQKATIKNELGEVSWERLGEKRASRIAVYHPGQITDDESAMSNLREWGVQTMIKFQKAIESKAEAALREVMGV
jgi:hypothetical protein